MFEQCIVSTLTNACVYSLSYTFIIFGFKETIFVYFHHFVSITVIFFHCLFVCVLRPFNSKVI